MQLLRILSLTLLISPVGGVDVCPWQCRNSKCEKDISGAFKCSEGCRDGLAGKYCREKCPTGCKRCQQFNPACISCEENVDGKNCSKKDDNSDATTYENELSTHVDEQSTHVDEQSTHVDEQSTHRDELSTYRDEKSTYRHEQSSYGDQQSVYRGDQISARTSEDCKATPPVFSDTGLVIFIVGILAAVIITVIVMISSYKLRKWRKRTKMRPIINKRGIVEVRMSDGYAYIEDVILDRDLYYSGLERPNIQSVKIDDLTEKKSTQYHHISLQQTISGNVHLDGKNENQILTIENQ